MQDGSPVAGVTPEVASARTDRLAQRPGADVAWSAPGDCRNGRKSLVSLQLAMVSHGAFPPAPTDGNTTN